MGSTLLKLQSYAENQTHDSSAYQEIFQPYPDHNKRLKRGQYDNCFEPALFMSGNDQDISTQVTGSNAVLGMT